MRYILLLIALALISFFYIDIPLAQFFHQHHIKIFAYITKLGEAWIYLIPSLLLYLFYKKRDLFLAKKALFIFWSVAISGIIVDLIKPLIGRARPKLLFEQHLFGFDPFTFKASFWSMPSGHSATAFAFGMAMASLFPRFKYLFFFYAFLIAFSRIALTKHYLNDVIIGSIIGALSAVILYKKWYNSLKKEG